MTTKECKLEIVKRYPEKGSINEETRENRSINQGFDEETALKEARRCLGQIKCESCDLCRLFCPDLAISREGTGEIHIDYNYCKGCGICALVCPKGAVKMVLDVGQ